MNKTFDQFNLQDNTRKFIRACGFTEPTPVQQAAVPLILKGRDVAAVSRTGSGKTHAYLIPIMDRIDPSRQEVQAVITAPTRELAVQIYQKAQGISRIDSRIVIRLAVGGSDREKEMKKILNQQPQIVIGTPGRIKDLFLEEGILRLDHADMLVIDEADMTLEYGFLDTIDAFAGRMKENLQMLCFSATIPDALKPFLKRYMHHPELVRIEEGARINSDVQHILVPCYHHTYAETILSILPGFQPYVCLIFANTRQEAADIAEALRQHGIRVTELHGDMESRQRKRALKQLQAAENTYVVATDLASRGIDVPEVTHVISCGFPKDLKFYIHRSGRTGRAGQTGTCYALYHEEDDGSIRSLMKMGIHFESMRYHGGQWQKLPPYGQKRPRKKDDLDQEISRLMTKKNSKVKPGYKKKRQAAIQELKQKKRREFIRAKIKEERTAMYKERARERREAGKK